MSIERTLRLVTATEPSPAEEGSAPAGLRVAFASRDGDRVDQHLAAARRFFVYSVTKSSAQVEEIGEFATKDLECEGGQLSSKLDWLGSCDVVYAMAVGSAARRQLLARGVLPLRVMRDTCVRSLLSLLREQVDDGLRAWLEHGPARVALEEEQLRGEESSHNQEFE